MTFKAFHIKWTRFHLTVGTFIWLFSKIMPVCMFHSSIHSFIHSFIHAFIRSFVCSFVLSWFSLVLFVLFIHLFASFCFTLKTLEIKLYFSWFIEKTVYFRCKRVTSSYLSYDKTWEKPALSRFKNQDYQWHVKFCGYVLGNANEILVARFTWVHLRVQIVVAYTENNNNAPQIYFLSHLKKKHLKFFFAFLIEHKF